MLVITVPPARTRTYLHFWFSCHFFMMWLFTIIFCALYRSFFNGCVALSLCNGLFIEVPAPLCLSTLLCIHYTHVYGINEYVYVCICRFFAFVSFVLWFAATSALLDVTLCSATNHLLLLPARRQVNKSGAYVVVIIIFCCISVFFVCTCAFSHVTTSLHNNKNIP